MATWKLIFSFLMVCVCAACGRDVLAGDSSVRLAEEAASDLSARYGIVGARLITQKPDACIYSARARTNGGAAAEDNFAIIAPYNDGCALLKAPYVTLNTADGGIVDFGYSVLHGAKKQEFLAALTGKNATDLVVALKASRLAGAFLYSDSAALALVTSIDGFSYKVQFTQRDPISITVERWQ